MHMFLEQTILLFTSWKMKVKICIYCGKALDNDPVNAGRLERISSNLSRAALSVSRIDEAVRKYPALVKRIFQNFADSHDPDGQKS